MIFPILKKLGYFLGGLLGVFLFVMFVKDIIDGGKGLGILNWVMALLGVSTAYYYFSEFKKYNLKENIKYSRSVFWSEIKKIVKSVVYYVVGYLIFAFLAACFICFVATIIWTITSFPEFLLHFIHYGPSTDLYNIIIPESFRAKPKEAIYILMMAGVFAFVCFSVAICFLQCFFINKFLLKDRDREMADVVKYLLMKIDEIYSKVDGSDEPSCDSPKEKE